MNNGESSKGNTQEHQGQQKRNRQGELTKAEQETIIRIDRETNTIDAYTAYAPDARAWRQAGYNVKAIRSLAGRETGWRATMPLDALRPFRRFKNGKVVRRRGHRMGFARSPNTMN